MLWVYLAFFSQNVAFASYGVFLVIFPPIKFLHDLKKMLGGPLKTLVKNLKKIN